MFEEVVSQLDLAFGCVHDGCSSAGKTIREGSPEDAPVEDMGDEFHLRGKVKKSWTGIVGKWPVLHLLKFKKIWLHITHSHRGGKGDPMLVRQLILNAVSHYQNEHDNCSEKSKCRKENYSVKHQIKDPREVVVFLNFMQFWGRMLDGKVFKHSWGMGNWLNESIHNVMIKYAPKRVVFGIEEYRMRIGFALLDYSENLKNKFEKDKTDVWKLKLKNAYFQKMM